MQNSGAKNVIKFLDTLYIVHAAPARYSRIACVAYSVSALSHEPTWLAGNRSINFANGQDKYCLAPYFVAAAAPQHYVIHFIYSFIFVIFWSDDGYILTIKSDKM